jgi:hypothetical protein
MAGTRPPADFSRSKPEIEIVRAGRRFGRIYSDAYSNPIGYGKSPSRFSDRGAGSLPAVSVSFISAKPSRFAFLKRFFATNEMVSATIFPWN